jgi:hypothetical protein
MKREILFIIILLFTGSIPFVHAQKSPLTGTWKLVSHKYIFPDGKEDSIIVKNGIRVYNDTHFSVFWEYNDSTTETCVAQYSLEGEILKLKILSHTNPRSSGMDVVGRSRVTGNRLIHFVNINGYIILEIYESLNPMKAENITSQYKPEALNLFLMSQELKKYGEQKEYTRIFQMGEALYKKASEMDPSIIHFY